MNSRLPDLVFVYNANSGIFSLASDFVHKILSPQTYACNLCMITYGNSGMKRQWKEFVESLPNKITFLHKDELLAKYPHTKTIKLPAVFTLHNAQLDLLITAKEITNVSEIDSLIDLVKNKLATK